MEGYQQGLGEKVQGIRSLNGRYKIYIWGEVKNSMGNGEVKECISMTHGHELRQGMRAGGGCRVKGNQGGKNRTTVIV